MVRNPDRAADPAEPTVADLVACRISHLSAILLDGLADRLPADDLAHYRGLGRAGEWAELAGALAAHLVKQHVPLSRVESDQLHHVLTAFDIPVPGHEYLNDRDGVLAAVRPN